MINQVFPGGVIDTQQDTSDKLMAICETFEETGILLASLNGTGSLPSLEMLPVLLGNRSILRRCHSQLS